MLAIALAQRNNNHNIINRNKILTKIKDKKDKKDKKNNILSLILNKYKFMNY